MHDYSPPLLVSSPSDQCAWCNPKRIPESPGVNGFKPAALARLSQPGSQNLPRPFSGVSSRAGPFRPWQRTPAVLWQSSLLFQASDPFQIDTTRTERPHKRAQVVFKPAATAQHAATRQHNSVYWLPGHFKSPATAQQAAIAHLGTIGPVPFHQAWRAGRRTWRTPLIALIIKVSAVLSSRHHRLRQHQLDPSRQRVSGHFKPVSQPNAPQRESFKLVHTCL
jgi:hypothetical protein